MNSPTSAKIASVRTAISRFGPVARQRDLLALGISTRQIRMAVQQGSVIRVARGHYAVPGVSTQDIYLARHQAQRTCLSKVSELGLWQLREPESVHVAAAHGRPIPGCVVHKHSGGQTLMGILRQCMACGTELEGLIILESAVVAKICTINDLQSEFTKRGDNAARALVETIDPQSMAITETAGRYHLKKAGHNVQGQAYVRDAGHLDLLVDGVLGIEADGKRFHDTENGWREDLRRDTMYVLRGVWRLRIPGEVVLYHPDIMMAWVSEALAMIRSTPRSR